MTIKNIVSVIIAGSPAKISGPRSPQTIIFGPRATLRCAAGGHFVSAGGALLVPGVTLINYKGNNISKYVRLTVIIDIAQKITKFINF